MGRPKSTNPKSVELGVSFDASTAQELKKYCEKYGISKAEAIRRGVRILIHESKNIER